MQRVILRDSSGPCSPYPKRYISANLHGYAQEVERRYKLAFKVFGPCGFYLPTWFYTLHKESYP
jgi:hypothetical protein